MVDFSVYDTRTLLGVIRDDELMRPPSSYWLNLCFNTVVNFTDEFIDFSKLTDSRKLAPLVVPTAQGRPVYSAAERLSRVKPAYVKPKDPVTASRMLRRVAGFGELADPIPKTPQQRYDATVADILSQHRRSIERRWEWLAAKAVIDGKVTLEGEAYPTVVVDFERAAGHTITLGVGERWGDTGVSIVESIQSMVNTIRSAPFGGPVTRMTVGTAVWNVMRVDPEIKELLNTNYRQGTAAQLNLGLREGVEAEYVGRLSENLEVWVYSDYYENESGVMTPFMGTKEVVFTGRNVMGVKAFGAIQDIEANFQALAIYPKMWNEQDPSVTFVMSQSAPLMVPVNPNNTLKATVLA